MAVTNYYTINGEIIAEKTAGSSRVDYLTDALGSVTGTLNQSAQVVNTYRYKPYGAQLAKTGTGADPSFLWVGSQGYRQTGRKFSDDYVRARHYSSAEGMWTTKDPFLIYPWRGSYFYADTSPVLLVDVSGLCGKDDCCMQLLDPHLHPKPNVHCKKPDGTPGTWVPFGPGALAQLRRDCTTQATCQHLLDLLKEGIADCKDMCDQAGKPPDPNKPGGYYPNDPWDARELCCEQRPGRWVSCGVFYCDRGGGLGGMDACWMMCAYKHEKRHQLQCRDVIRPPYGIPNPDAWEECDAYRVTVRCLLHEASKKCGKNIPSDIRQKVTECLNQPVFNRR
jgi:RHS repeat-associated protein